MPGAVTISTNMAGRGTDIVLGGGDPAAHATGRRARRPLRHRHEPPREPARRRPAARPRRAAGRPRPLALLRQPRGRPHPALRRAGPDSAAATARRRRTARSTTRSSAREIARAQRIIEGQNFEIRRTLWRYSAMVEEQRQLMCERREEPAARRVGADGRAPRRRPSTTRRWRGPSARREVARAENRLTMLLLDRRWSDHLALIEDIREGIHLQRYGGRDAAHRVPAADHRRLRGDDGGAAGRGGGDVRAASRRAAARSISTRRPPRPDVDLDVPRQRQPVPVVRAVADRARQHRPCRSRLRRLPSCISR